MDLSFILSNNFHKTLVSHQIILQQLKEAELKKNFSERCGFIPDHLGWNCRSGRNVFKIEVPPFESYVTSPNDQDFYFMSCLSAQKKMIGFGEINYQGICYQARLVLKTEADDARAEDTSANAALKEGASADAARVLEIQVFDKSHKSRESMPFVTLKKLEAGWLQNFDTLECATFIKLPIGDCLVLGGSHEGLAALLCISLEDEKTLFELQSPQVDCAAWRKIVAIRTSIENFANRLYLLDSQGLLYTLDLQTPFKNIFCRCINKIRFEVLANLFVLQDECEDILGVYGIGRNEKGEQGFFKVRDFLKQDQIETQMLNRMEIQTVEPYNINLENQLLSRGEFQNLFRKNGKFFLMPKNLFPFEVQDSTLIFDERHQQYVLAVLSQKSQKHLFLLGDKHETENRLAFKMNDKKQNLCHK